MNAAEIERELEELETRMERLRALYEQYFMGIERLEPQIPRKDVERRIWVMRREQIRNTGLRFRFQMLIQRYNTFQQYWGRIMREIESGTYRRDVMRAAQRFGQKEAVTLVGRKRAERYQLLADKQQTDKDRRLGRRPAIDEAPPPPIDETEDDIPVELEEPKAARPGAVVDPEAAKQRVAALAAQMRAARADKRATEVLAEPLDLDLDLDGPPARKSIPPTSRRRSTMPPARKSSGRMKAMKLPPPPLAPSELPKIVAEPPEKRPPQRRNSSRSMRAVRPSQFPAPAPAPAPAVASKPAAPPARAGSGPAIGRAGSNPAIARAGSGSAIAKPAGVPAAPARPAAGTGPDDLSDARLRQIYAKYVETKRSVNESTAGITYEKLADSLRAQAAKLKSTHASKRVDYEVVVKDGKTMLKPILRGS